MGRSSLAPVLHFLRARLGRPDGGATSDEQLLERFAFQRDEAAFEAMVAGKLNCTVECNPLLGPAAFDAVEAVLAGKQVPKKTIVKDEVFDQSVAKNVIADRKY